MTRPLPRPTPTNAYIGTVEADFRVTAPNGPLSSPEKLLAAVRAEILPALSDVLESDPFATSTLTLPHLEIDIGDWPDDPPWPEVRLHLAAKLRAALMPYLSEPPAHPSAPRNPRNPQPTTTLLESLGALPPTDQLAALLTHVTGHPDRAEALRAALTTMPERIATWSGALRTAGLDAATLPDVLRLLAQDPDALGAFARAAPDRDFRDAVALHRGLAPLAHLPGQAQIAGLLRFFDQTPDVARVMSRPAADQVTRRLSAPVQTALAGLRGQQTTLKLETADLLAHLSTLPAPEQLPALLHHLTQAPASLDILRSPAHAGDLALCAPDVRTALAMAPAHTDQAMHLAHLAAIMDRSRTPPPQTARDWRAQVSAQAPELVEKLRTPARDRLRDTLLAKGLPQEDATVLATAIARITPHSSDMDLHTALIAAGVSQPRAEALTTLAATALGDLKIVSQKAIHRLEYAEEQMRHALMARGATPPEASHKAARLAGLWSLLSPQDLPKNADQTPREVTGPTAQRSTDPLEGAKQTINEPSDPAIGADQTPGAWAALATALDRALLAQGAARPQPDTDTLKALWRAATGDKRALLTIRPAPELRTLARALVPTQARALAERVASFADDPATPHFALAGLSAALLDGRPIDFDALSAAPSLAEALTALTGIDTARIPPLDLTFDTAETQALQTLINASLPADTQVILRQIWAAWPITPDAETETKQGNSTALALWDSIITALLEPGVTAARTQRIARLLETLEPDPDTRTARLRIVSARLSLPNPKADRAVQLATRQVVETILAPPAADTPSQVPDETPLPVTEAAGLVILHPYLALLLKRLGVEPENRQLPYDLLPKALAILTALAPTQAPDPLHRVLLGLPHDAPIPEARSPLDADDTEMIAGLLRAVIAQWGKLGATSPDGLRETFLQRTGTLEFGDDKITLRVVPGPFDMLMDGMPWALTPVKLPWMPLPLHVIWRNADA